MELTDAERTARSRFLMLSLIRLAGIVLLIAGVAIWKTDLLRDGGWPALGITMFIVGLLETLLLPMVFVRAWRTPPAD